MSIKPTPIPFHPPFILIHRDGSTWVFDDLVSLCRAVRAWRISVEEYHSWYSSVYDYQFKLYTNDWIVRDDRGRTVTSNDISDALPYPRPYGYRLGNWRWSDEVIRAAERGLPIPGTGRRGSGHYFRRPANNGANRARVAAAYRDDDEDIVPKTRIKCPPDAWDDGPIAARYDRNWKRHRKTQWKT